MTGKPCENPIPDAINKKTTEIICSYRMRFPRISAWSIGGNHLRMPRDFMRCTSQTRMIPGYSGGDGKWNRYMNSDIQNSSFRCGNYEAVKTAVIILRILLLGRPKHPIKITPPLLVYFCQRDFNYNSPQFKI